MNYNLNNLGSQNFEYLVQSLCKKIIGEGVSIFGAGPDGQREATFEGKAPYPSDSETWDGYWVIQAKFKNPDTKTPDFPWIKECFEKEMEGFQNKKSQGKTIPKNYLFFTNIVLTPAYEKGIKDRMNALINDYTDLIPNIHILGANDIYTFLDNNRDVATAYSSYILSGDILNYLYDNLQTTNKNRQKAFMRYLIGAFNDDYCSRMEQAGQVTENKTSIDKVYIDLTFEEEISEISEKFIKHALTAGNSNFRFSKYEKNSISPLDAIGEDTLPISNKYVLKGSAGQGKSTVCQFLAQIYRAYFLKNFSDTSFPDVEKFIDTIVKDGIDVPSCYRIPMKIELRLYSSWIIKRQQEQKTFDLITYISSIIAEKASEKFDNETLRLYLSKYSWIFFFDGLDEVPESSNRTDIMKEIEHFINIELRQADTDSVFFATTRPEGYVGEFNKVDFSHLNILPLDKNDCFSYLDKLLLSIENDDTKRKRYLKILNEAYDNKQIAFMMRTPLQATIMAILIKAGGEPPRDKYSLFKDYFDIILKREKQKGTGGILNNNQDLIESVYFLLGYELQEKASTTEGSDALISLSRMKELISITLEFNGICAGTDAHKKLLNEAYFMIVNRINFASEIKEGFIGFSIRSMQEYLASEHIVKTNNDQQLGALLKNLAKNSYWKNTFIFVVEGINKNKPYFLNNLIDTILNELNGSDISVRDLDELPSVYYGSQIAFSLLANNIFKNKPNIENKLCKHIGNYCSLQPSNEISQILHMSDNVKKELTDYILQKDSKQFTNADFAIISCLLQDNNCRKILKKLESLVADNIALQYLSIAKGNCTKPLLDVISIALNNGILLPLTTAQLAFIIDNSSLLNSEKGKNTAFKILIKLALRYDFVSVNAYNKIFNDYFNFDVEQPLCLFKDIFSVYDYSTIDGIRIHYKIPKIEQSKLDSVISIAEQFDLKGLCLILKTLNSEKIEDYLLFYHNIDSYKEEISVLGEDSLIRCNYILATIWKSLNIKGIFDESILVSSNVFQNKFEINTFDDIINEYKKDFSLYQISSFFPDQFSNFYPKIRELLSLNEIKKFPRLCRTIIYMYAYQHKSEYFSIFDDKVETINDLNSYLDEMLELLKIDCNYNYWSKYIWSLIFLNFPVKNYINFPDVTFYDPKLYNSKKYPLSFSSSDSETILNNLIKYIQITENPNAFRFLYDFILMSLEYKSLIKIDFSSLTSFNDKKIYCLIEITKAKSKEDVISNILPLLSDNEVFAYIYELSFSINLPNYFLPVYIFYLKKFRETNSFKEIKELELKIKDYITSTPVDL